MWLTNIRLLRSVGLIGAFVVWGPASIVNAQHACPDLINSVNQNDSKTFDALWKKEKDRPRHTAHPSDTSNILTFSDELRVLPDNYQILFVKGFLSNATKKAGVGYFEDQKKWFESHGVTTFRIEKGNVPGWDSENLPTTNAPFLINTIHTLHNNHPQKEIIIISHSKGGLDTLAALLSNDGQDLLKLTKGKKSIIAGWISLQAPFEGTPIADELSEYKTLTFLLANAMGGEKQSLSDMSRQTRCNASAKARDNTPLENIGRKINMLSFASWKKKDPDNRSALAIPRDTIKRGSGLNNDGLVPVQSAILKNKDGKVIGHFIKTKGFDHAVPVMPGHMFPIVETFQRLRKLLPNIGKEKEGKGAYDINRENFTRVLLKIWLANQRTK